MFYSFSFSCLAYLSKIQAESVPPVKDFDLIVMDLRLVENQQILLKPSFGYVQDTSRCILRNHHYINRSCKKIQVVFYVVSVLFLYLQWQRNWAQHPIQKFRSKYLLINAPKN